MSEESSKEFEIRIDEERPDSVFQDDINSIFINWWALVHGFIMLKSTDSYDAHLLKVFFDDAVRRFVENAQ